jgi:hypothetical protein
MLQTAEAIDDAVLAYAILVGRPTPALQTAGAILRRGSLRRPLGPSVDSPRPGS